MIKVAILTRVIFEYRAPIFEKLASKDDIDLKVYYGSDLKNTKIVSTKNNYNFKKIKLFNFKFTLQSKNGRIYFPVTPLLFFKLIKDRPDVVLSEGASHLFDATQGFIYAKLFRKKYVWWSLGRLEKRNVSILRKLSNPFIHFIEKNSSSILTYSSVGEKYFQSLGINKRKIFKAINVVDTDKVISNLKYHEEKKSDKYISSYRFKFLFVGALTKFKNLESMIIAFSKMNDLSNDIELLIVGDGEHRNELEALVKKLNVNNISFFGNRISDSHFFWRAADVFVLPGLGGLAISEAMCYKLPILCSIGDGTERDLVTKKNGFREENMNPENIIKYIRNTDLIIS